MMEPVLDKRRCPVQPQMCKAIPACPTGAITYFEDEQEPLGGRIEFDLTKCDGCGKCAEECCGKAIEMKES
jgi:Pyruvate/2-oxoacid:ferredoxin oxidoreductase delta subunit